MARVKGRGDATGRGRGRRDTGPALRRPSDLRGWYALGLQARGRFPAKGDRYHAPTITHVARELGVSKDMVWKAVDFSWQYDQKGLDGLLHPPAGRPLTFSHVRRLLSVEERAVRAELQRRASADGWGHEELGAAIREMRAPRSSGGRRPKQAGSPGGRLRQIRVRSEEWLNRYERAWGGDPLAGEDEGEAEDPGALDAPLTQAIRALERLREAAKELEDRLKKARTRVRRRRTAGSGSRPGGRRGPARPAHD